MSDQLPGAVRQLKALIQSVAVKQHHIDKPGMPGFFMSSTGQTYLEALGNTYKVCL